MQTNNQKRIRVDE